MPVSSYVLGWIAAILMGLSKTGVPGVSLPAVLLLSEAFAGNEKLSVAVMLPILIVGDVISVICYYKHVEWRRLVALLPYVALGMAPGVLVLMYASHAEFRLVLGYGVLALLLVELARQYCGWTRLPDHWWFVAGMGTVSGFGTMVGNAAGPVMSLYLVAQKLRKECFMGTWAWFFLIVNLSKVPILAALTRADIDLITPVSMGFVLAILPGVFVGAALGRVVFHLLPQKVFDPLVLGLAALAAVRMVAI